MIGAHLQLVGINSLKKSVEYVLEIVQVVVLGADRVVVGLFHGQSSVPPVVPTHGYVARY